MQHLFDIIISEELGDFIMIKPDLIVRTHRRSLCLTITKNGDLVVRAPMRMNLNDILKYTQEKEKWIDTKQKEIQSKLSINKDILDYKKFYFLGKKYSLQKTSGIKKIELSQNVIFVPNISNEELFSKLKRWYIKQADKILKERLEYFANIMQIDYRNVSLCNSKSKWGSCDIYRNIKLNFRLIMLPHKTIDFVLIHELSHIIEFNHSKDFYKIIQTIMPSYKLQQKVLKENDYILQLFR